MDSISQNAAGQGGVELTGILRYTGFSTGGARSDRAGSAPPRFDGAIHAARE
jgi:hypothetical protein